MTKYKVAYITSIDRRQSIAAESPIDAAYQFFKSNPQDDIVRVTWGILNDETFTSEQLIQSSPSSFKVEMISPGDMPEMFDRSDADNTFEICYWGKERTSAKMIRAETEQDAMVAFFKHSPEHSAMTVNGDKKRNVSFSEFKNIFPDAESILSLSNDEKSALSKEISAAHAITPCVDKNESAGNLFTGVSLVATLVSLILGLLSSLIAFLSKGCS